MRTIIHVILLQAVNIVLNSTYLQKYLFYYHLSIIDIFLVFL